MTKNYVLGAMTNNYVLMTDNYWLMTKNYVPGAMHYKRVKKLLGFENSPETEQSDLVPLWPHLLYNAFK